MGSVILEAEYGARSCGNQTARYLDIIAVTRCSYAQRCLTLINPMSHPIPQVLRTLAPAVATEEQSATSAVSRGLSLLVRHFTTILPPSIHGKGCRFVGGVIDPSLQNPVRRRLEDGGSKSLVSLIWGVRITAAAIGFATDRTAEVDGVPVKMFSMAVWKHLLKRLRACFQ